MALLKNIGNFLDTFTGMIEGITTQVSGTNEIFQKFLDNDNYLKTGNNIIKHNLTTDVLDMQTNASAYLDERIDNSDGRMYICVNESGSAAVPTSTSDFKLSSVHNNSEQIENLFYSTVSTDPSLLFSSIATSGGDDVIQTLTNCQIINKKTMVISLKIVLAADAGYFQTMFGILKPKYRPKRTTPSSHATLGLNSSILTDYDDMGGGIAYLDDDGVYCSCKNTRGLSSSYYVTLTYELTTEFDGVFN